MHPFLAAQGPAFGRGRRVSGLSSLDVYPLMCQSWAGGEAQQRQPGPSTVPAGWGELPRSAPGGGPGGGSPAGARLPDRLFIFLKKKMAARGHNFARLELLQDDSDDDPLIG